MFESIEALVYHLPGLLQARWTGNHWPELALGLFIVTYSFVSIFIGSIWSGGHVATVTIDERPFAFWSCVLVYAGLGVWLAFYM